MYSGGGYTGGGHTRDASSGFGEVMGGGPVHQQQEFLSVNTSPGATKFNAVAHVPSMKEMEDLKSKYKEADDIARDAEASRRQIVAQLDELRRLADEAESKVRAATAVVVPKKKGLFRHGGAAQKRDEVRMNGNSQWYEPKNKCLTNRNLIVCITEGSSKADDGCKGQEGGDVAGPGASKGC